MVELGTLAPFRGATVLDVPKVGCSFTERMPRQCANTWGRWLFRREAAFIRRMIGWQVAARYRWEAELVVACRMGVMNWRRACTVNWTHVVTARAALAREPTVRNARSAWRIGSFAPMGYI